jgi:hypothetical protein
LYGFTPKLGTILVPQLFLFLLLPLQGVFATDVPADSDTVSDAQATPVLAPPTDPGGAPSGVPEVATPETPKPDQKTLEQIREEIAEAEKDRQEALKPDAAAPNEALREKWGVEVIGISRTTAGYMLDFRFRVVDAKKALPLFDHRIKPYVTAEKSGLKLPVPEAAKVGAFRPTNRGNNIKSDKTYYMVFANPDDYLKPGDKVSVVIGDFRVEHLTVKE